MKREVGDTVKIRTDLIIDQYYGKQQFVHYMDKFKGAEAFITDVYTNHYWINIDDEKWCWTDEMFED